MICSFRLVFLLTALALASCTSSPDRFPSDPDASPPHASNSDAAKPTITDDAFEDAVTRSGAAHASSRGPSTASTLADSVLSPPDTSVERRFEALMAYAREASLHTRPTGAIMQALGLRFHGVPYVEGTLDSLPQEALVVKFDGFDCVTFVETTLALAQGVKRQNYDYAAFVHRLARLRYRDDTPVGYCERLHYFSEWISNNQARGLVTDLSASLGGRAMNDSLDFMSTHRDAYRRFATNDSLYQCVQHMERGIGEAQRRTPLHYVPQDRIDAVADRLRAGDVVAFATSIDGLDVSHTGLVYVDDTDDGPGAERTVGLLHASTSKGVVVSPDLQQYVQQIGHQIGIVIARPTEPSASTSGGAAR